MSAKKIFLVLAVASLILPSLALAQTAPSLWPTGYWGPLLSCTGNYVGGTSAGPTNPCQSLCDLIQTFINILYFIMSIGIFIVAPILFAAGAIMIMAAGANPGLLEQGKKTLTGTLIGLAIILSSYLIVATFIYVIGGSGLWGRIGGFGASSCTVAPS